MMGEFVPVYPQEHLCAPQKPSQYPEAASCPAQKGGYQDMNRGSARPLSSLCRLVVIEVSSQNSVFVILHGTKKTRCCCLQYLLCRLYDEHCSSCCHLVAKPMLLFPQSGPRPYVALSCPSFSSISNTICEPGDSGWVMEILTVPFESWPPAITPPAPTPPIPVGPLTP